MATGGWAGVPMELYNFLRDTLAWTATIACLWPLNAPWLALAFKIQNGAKPIDMENDEYWTRSVVTSLVIGLITAGFILIDWVLAGWAELPAGPVHLIVYVGYVPLCVWVLTLFFAMDDLLNGLSLFIIYLYMPTLELLVLNWLLGFWTPLLNFFYDWLLPATS
jgi:hypothetical protein